MLESGGICAFPGCRRPLVSAGAPEEPGAVIAEVAHIVAENREGPRGKPLKKFIGRVGASVPPSYQPTRIIGVAEEVHSPTEPAVALTAPYALRTFA